LDKSGLGSIAARLREMSSALPITHDIESTFSLKLSDHETSQRLELSRRWSSDDLDYGYAENVDSSHPILKNRVSLLPAAKTHDFMSSLKGI
jgi:hypothetical protein